MTKLAELAKDVRWAFGLVIDDDELARQAINAARTYLAWGRIASVDPVVMADAPPTYPPPDPAAQVVMGYNGTIYDAPPRRPEVPTYPAPTTPLSADSDITDGEWGIIRPLYLLYVERENARGLEASRGLGVDVYGRTVDQVEADIRQYETQDLPRLAFAQTIETV
ncbi:hypothetical protein [Burkholderia ubonensis]|uniref:Uncharacterized protein n=1 Tax=Burkholderia ubonensis TaxID=101571 RepID=A0ABD4DZV4_9BURK|nr:hypothetical protein [Burkholderia ubonensis]KVN83499.1 hypothetical protein WJ68_16440 [Burkholderia ubonensis]